MKGAYRYTANPYMPDVELRSLLDGDTAWSHRVICPTCGDTYMHPVAVEVNAGGHITTITDNTPGVRTLGKPAGRGVLITVRFACESGDEASISLHFHKGQTFVGARELGPSADWPHTIWRD